MDTVTASNSSIVTNVNQSNRDSVKKTDLLQVSPFFRVILVTLTAECIVRVLYSYKFFQTPKSCYNCKHQMPSPKPKLFEWINTILLGQGNSRFNYMFQLIKSSFNNCTKNQHFKRVVIYSFYSEVSALTENKRTSNKVSCFTFVTTLYAYVR